MILIMKSYAIDMLLNTILDPISACSEKPIPVCPEIEESHWHETAQDFAKRVLRDKPTEIQNDDYLNNLYMKANSTGRRRVKVVHISDVHFDERYAVGSNW